MAKIKEVKVEDLIQDDNNANRGTEVGGRLIEESIRTLGLGRSVLVDKDGRIIAGNKTHKGTLKNGIKKAVVIETDGSELIVVQRTDLSLDEDKGRALALADNRTAEANLNWEPGALEIHFDAVVNLGLDSLVFELPQVVTDDDLSGLFTPRAGADPDEEEIDDPGEEEGFSFVLNYTEEDYRKVKGAIERIGGTPERIFFDLLGLSDKPE